MTRIAPNRDPNPLVGVTRLLVDGTNLLHVLTRGSARLPPAALVGRLRATIPAETAIEIVFDGPPERGIRGERIAHGVSVRFSGRQTADRVLILLVEAVAMAAGAPVGGGSLATDTILVVTDDRDLRHALQRRGARTAGAAWLVGRLERSKLAAPSVGNARPPRPPRIGQAPPGSIRSAVPGGRRGLPTGGGDGADRDRDPDGDPGPGWAPGRGATRKRGNGKRSPKR